MDSHVFHKLSYGMYIVSSKKDGKFNGQIANTAFQITSDPAVIAISINKSNLTHEYIESSRAFGISILNESAPMTFIGTFGFKSGRNIDKFAQMKTKIGQLGVPFVLDYAVGALEMEVIESVDMGTHTVFFGKAVNGEILSQEKPMTYAYYHEVKKGVSPKTAPTYIKE